MGYCAACRTEYKDGLRVCADCGQELSMGALPPPEPGVTEAYVEVFSSDAREDIETARQVLGDASVAFMVRELGSGAFPIHVGKEGEARVAVAATQLQVAHALIKEAIDDGAISTRGTLLN